MLKLLFGRNIRDHVDDVSSKHASLKRKAANALWRWTIKHRDYKTIVDLRLIPKLGAWLFDQQVAFPHNIAGVVLTLPSERTMRKPLANGAVMKALECLSARDWDLHQKSADVLLALILGVESRAAIPRIEPLLRMVLNSLSFVQDSDCFRLQIIGSLMRHEGETVPEECRLSVMMLDEP